MSKIKNVMLTITEKCNLKCVYCFETNKSFESMQFATAIEVIESELLADNHYEKIVFDFMGGEPFIEYSLIKQICEYVWSRRWPKEYLFFATTNGTLVHGEIQQWLKENKDRFVCGISLDGLPEVHNANRSNSYNKIDVNFFQTTWPLQEAKMTVYPDTLCYLYEGTKALHDLGFRIKGNLAYGPDWGGKELQEVYQTEMSKLIDYYTEHTEIIPSTIIAMDIRPVAYPKERLRKWCGMGDQMVAYDISGKRYPCHFFQDMSSPDLQTSLLSEIDFATIQNSLQDRCKNCILRNACPTCYGYNYSKTKNFGEKDAALCSLSRLTATASATLAFRRIKKMNQGAFENLDDDEKELVVAISTIQAAAKANDWCISH